MIRALLLSAAALIAVPAAAQDIAITNAKLVIGDGSAPIDGGTVVVRGGKVVAAGVGVAVPAGIERVDAGGRWVTPGIVAAFSRVGLVEVDAVGGTNDRNAPRTRFSAGLDIAPALNPMGSPVAVNRASGVTRAIVAPGGSSNLFAGQGAVVDLADDMDMVTKPRALQFVAFGEDGSAKAGGSRAATFLLFREQLLAARSYARNPATLAEWGNDAMIQRADADALVQVIIGVTPLFVRVDRASDILNVVKLKGEFPALKLVLVGVTEGWLVARELAAAKVPVLVSPLTDLPSSFEQLGATQSNAGRLKAAGVDVSVGVFDDDDAHKMGYATQYAGNLVGLARVPGASGMTWDQAFASISSAPARAVGMEASIGSLRPGRVGDVVVWDNDPLELGSRPTAIWIDGKAQSLTTRQDRLRDRYATPQEGALPKAYDR
ncbi:MULTISPECIES: amidohydrolase family protein [unclassified Sphingopyxis]|uniref:amidohydrolase family protein n=1 Tax=unclassified Sphingopyxis TaxID=2614943 RepID=UPI0028649B12|nr:MULTISPECIES: amidohydrolase family protein [unclassified Sphingopyxis]MDR6835017.1 imidazolonepropionase-like amidohydrolase [Sphingopyxis sp. BE122]MDR7227288.1 imidazolonepropionase-like amidohydrolase [Sphingopyxis sp. BE259]